MIKPLTSLRFFFASMVFTSHLGFVETTDSFYNWLTRNVFFEGYLGVSFFFILSGFILTYSYEKKILSKKKSIKNFYIARFARIYPLHFITLLFIIPYFFYKQNFDVGSLVLHLGLVQSFVPDQNIYYSFNSPSWSISDEMFFYLIFPFCIVLINKIKYITNYIWPIVIFLLIILISSTSEMQHKTIFYVNPLSRSLDFILGISLFHFFKRNDSKLIPSVKKANLMEILSVIVFLVFFGLHNFLIRGFRFSVYYWIPMCFIIFTFAHQKGFISKLLSAKWLVFLGEISFGFYMIHYLVLQYGIWFKETFKINLDDISYAILLFLITIIFSLLSYKLYEKPMNTFIKRKFTTHDS